MAVTGSGDVARKVVPGANPPEPIVNQIEIKPEIAEPTLDDGDHERMAHIVDERFGTIAESIVNGTPVFALCGKVWRASRDPKKYPLCETCVEMAKGHGMNVPNQ
jgi:hypothetical protein